MFLPIQSYLQAVIISDSNEEANLLRHMLLSLDLTRRVLVFDKPQAGLGYVKQCTPIDFPGLVLLDLSNTNENSLKYIQLFKDISGKTQTILDLILVIPQEFAGNEEQYFILPDPEIYLLKPIRRSDLLNLLTAFNVHKINLSRKIG